MARHGERIHKRKDGRWEGRYKIGNDENGRTLYSSVYGKTYGEAKQKLKDAENNTLIKNSNSQNKMLFSFAVEQWLLTKRHSMKKSTEHKYEYLIKKHILPELGNLKLNDLNTLTFSEYVDDKLKSGSVCKKSELSGSYVRSIMIVIDSVIKFAYHQGWCNSFVPIYKPPVAKKEMKILSLAEQLYLEKNLTTELSNTSIGIIIALQTGLRIGEICALKWDDVDIDNCILYVRSTVSRVKNPQGNGSMLIIDTPKTESSSRSIPFNISLKELLLRIKEKSISEYVISNKEDFVSPRTFEYRYHQIMKKLNLPELNFHSLRHTFATRCIEYGVDVKTLSEILGHSNASITLNTYVHSSMELKRAQLEKLPTISA